MKVALRMNRASLFLNNNVAKSLSNLFSYPKNKNEDPFELDFALGLSGGNQIEQNSILDYEKRYLNKIPNELNASYTKIPILINMLILFGILAMVILRCGLLQRTELHKTSNRKIFKTSLSSMLSFFAIVLGIQDMHFGPSRVSIPYLLEKGWLPSSLSKINTFQPQLTGTNQSISTDFEEKKYNSILSPLSVHYIQYENLRRTVEDPCLKEKDMIYFNHGFGASSLSWLPSIPILVDRLNAKVGVCHDAPGKCSDKLLFSFR